MMHALFSTVIDTSVAAGLLMFSAVSPENRSVVKIYVTIQQEDYSLPWQPGRPIGATGSGFIISKRRILTNAHIVSDTRFIEVQKSGDSKRYAAKVSLVGHDCDLAMLTVDDESFFSGTRPVTFADELPKLNDEVIVQGYPLGGARLSVTRGIVSRIDYSLYSHSGVDEHLVLQVDAAINPGNSGGPVIYNGRVVGLAFQALSMAENIGYAIPVPVIQRFLKDVEDEEYNGYPEMGAAVLSTRNIALRKDRGLPEERTGTIVWHLDLYGAGKGLLQPGDILLSIDGLPIADDGTVNLNGNNVDYPELLERKQWGESVRCSVWRNRTEQEITIPLTNPRDPFAFRNEYDERPEYYICGGLVFSPLTQQYLQRVVRRVDNSNEQQLIYCRQYAKLDNLCEGRRQFVVLIKRLPHTVNMYAGNFINGIVAEVNGRRVGCMSDIKTAVESRKSGFHVLRFEGMDETLVLDAEAVLRANGEIWKTYGIAEPEHIKDGSK